MKIKKSSTPAQAAASRANGRKGGTKRPDISRWNALRHALTAKLTIREGKHLPEYGKFAAQHAALLEDLGALGPLSVEDFMAVDKFIADCWRVTRAYRYELSETEKPDNGMLSPAMSNILRYSSLANRQFKESILWIKEIRAQKETAAAGLTVVEVAAGHSPVVAVPDPDNVSPASAQPHPLPSNDESELSGNNDEEPHTPATASDGATPCTVEQSLPCSEAGGGEPATPISALDAEEKEREKTRSGE